jgi:hypothetical protein
MNIDERLEALRVRLEALTARIEAQKTARNEAPTMNLELLREDRKKVGERIRALLRVEELHHERLAQRKGGEAC